MHIILEGIITGLIVSISFGAGFFSLIQTSISRGIHKAVYISAGVLLSDSIFIFLSVFATSFISYEMTKYAYEMRLVGMILLILMGIYSILKSSKVINPNIVDDPHLMYYISKGFLINTFNPLNALTWIGVSLFLQSALQYTFPEIILFFCTVIVFAFATQMGVCYSAHRLRKHLSVKFIHRINIFVGIILIASGIFIYTQKNMMSKDSPIEKAEQMMIKKK
ncbi:MAG: LysE family translocator [Bacteroidia bacterium]